MYNIIFYTKYSDIVLCIVLLWVKPKFTCNSNTTNMIYRFISIIYMSTIIKKRPIRGLARKMIRQVHNKCLNVPLHRISNEMRMMMNKIKYIHISEFPIQLFVPLFSVQLLPQIFACIRHAFISSR